MNPKPDIGIVDFSSRLREKLPVESQSLAQVGSLSAIHRPVKLIFYNNILGFTFMCYVKLEVHCKNISSLFTTFKYTFPVTYTKVI